MKVLNSILLAILVIAAINVGCIGLFGFNFLRVMFGTMTNLLYIIAGIAGLWGLTFFRRMDDDVA